MKEFFARHQKIITMAIIVVIAFAIYRYFWQRTSIIRDLGLSNDTQQSSVFSNLGMMPKGCLDVSVQQQIADAIGKKLEEIDACPCNGLRNNNRSAFNANSNVQPASYYNSNIQPISNASKNGNNNVQPASYYNSNVQPVSNASKNDNNNGNTLLVDGIPISPDLDARQSV